MHLRLSFYQNIQHCFGLVTHTGSPPEEVTCVTGAPETSPDLHRRLSASVPDSSAESEVFGELLFTLIKKKPFRFTDV